MRQKKFMFMWNIMVFNLIKPLPYSIEYFHKHFMPIEKDMDRTINGRQSRYKRIVNTGKENFGWMGVLCANVALMLFCLPLSIASDYFINITNSFVVKAIINLFCFLLMVEKFDILRLRDKRNILKLLYISYSLLSASYWSVTCLFLVAFENIVF